jgi:Family of unknown function (DUF6209)
MHRINRNQPPRLTFTRDFHELLRGRLEPGQAVTIRYDPARIVPPDDPYTFGDPARPIRVHATFAAAAAPAVEQTLVSLTGPLPEPIVDVTGQGSMLVATLQCPADAQEVILWFSFRGSDGRVRYDSEFGRNFRFPFLDREFHVVEADVAAGRFTLEAATVPGASEVTVYYRVAPTQHAKPVEVSLRRRAQPDPDGWIHWVLDPPADVGAGSAVTFKCYYNVRRTWYKDDNDGVYYTVPRPAGHDEGPAPPRELAEASRAWAQPAGARRG